MVIDLDYDPVSGVHHAPGDKPTVDLVKLDLAKLEERVLAYWLADKEKFYASIFDAYA